MKNVPVVNKTMDLKDCGDQWRYNQKYDCYCLEDVVYTPVPKAVRFQRLSIFVPACYMNPDGSRKEGKRGKYTTETAPVIFENNASGYAEMEHTWLDGPRNYAGQYLERGMVYVSCGCRGRQTVDKKGEFIGKSPVTLIDFKTAIRFLRHNCHVLAGNMDHMVSVGWSAGGAMSALLGVTGNNDNYTEALRENGAFMDETDAVFASQIYCPIIDLEHADMAYEWQFAGQYDFEPSPFAPGGEMTDFQKALSRQLGRDFITYFNSLGLKLPGTDEAMVLGEDGRSGNAYGYLMAALNASATVYLNKLKNGELKTAYSVEEYMDGKYSYETVDVEGLMEFIRDMETGAGTEENSEGEFEGFGHRMAMPEMPMKTVQGDKKHAWLSWDGGKAKIKSLDDFQKVHRRRMKTCPSFDFLDAASGENQLFGNSTTDYMHFSKDTARAIAALKDQFPQECARYEEEFERVLENSKQERQVYLVNPLNFVGTREQTILAEHFRIHVGACDADTSFMVSLILAVKLWNTKKTNVIYHLIWDQPHSEADYEGEVCDWIENICG